MTFELTKEALAFYSKEKAYKNAKTQWEQYTTWKKTRNPKRAEFEEKFGYDTKHGSHLIRLMRMCREILTEGHVIVKRPDRDELLNIKRGGVSYEALIDEAERIESECALLYLTSKALPKKPNVDLIDSFIVNLTKRYLFNV